MVEDSYWTLSAELLIGIIDSFERNDSLNMSSDFLTKTIPHIKWVIRITQRDAEKLVDWVIENSDEDNKIINWLMSLLIPNENNVSDIRIVRELLKSFPKRLNETNFWHQKFNPGY